MGGGNIVVRDFPPKLAIRREVQIVGLQLDIENYFRELARIKKNSFKNKILVVCDRGAMDARAYLPQELWQAVLGKLFSQRPDQLEPDRSEPQALRDGHALSDRGRRGCPVLHHREQPGALRERGAGGGH